jgi:hypothetical protein
MKPTLTTEKITPEIAKRMLAKMVNNRTLSENKVIDYAVAMDKDDWSLN